MQVTDSIVLDSGVACFPTLCLPLHLKQRAAGALGLYQMQPAAFSVCGHRKR